MLTRRELIERAAMAAVPLSLGFKGSQGPSHARLPRWRGFNLLEKFTLAGNAPYREEDFDLTAAWGFDFLRLPCDYRCWTEAPGTYREAVLKEIDAALGWARARGIHLNLCLHRAPGYCVNPPKEPLDLWSDGEGGEEARRQFAHQWAMFAARYRGVPNSALSFDLVNEPANVSAEAYARAVRSAVSAIRREDPARLVVADGLQYGTRPVPELIDLRVAQSTRGYAPFQLTHYGARWVEGSDKWPVPEWPLRGDDGAPWDRARLGREQIEPWKELEKRGVGVHVGEWGAHNRTPHAVVLAWMRDQLALWRGAGWGWALWNLRGSFGVLDSGRTDVKYETLKGRKLDRAMLELLRAG
ncbi:MAG TPA: cellulase family glycosylhydrolase [Pyrinomonadaceae bacterium]|jgi:endoglucanase|nr:cellulase family glycosylhydrolase [Pyrinomonadaceae bacterium]